VVKEGGGPLPRRGRGGWPARAPQQPEERGGPAAQGMVREGSARTGGIRTQAGAWMRTLVADETGRLKRALTCAGRGRRHGTQGAPTAHRRGTGQGAVSRANHE